jgi:hypothetical protein
MNRPETGRFTSPERGDRMAGNGPAPKDPARRARRNKPAESRVIYIVPDGQPELPEFTIQVKLDGELVTQEFNWPTITREWWTMLGRHPLRLEFTELDWSYLLDTARMHAAFWMGDIGLAPELRLREAKYGFTPEDRARLRIQFAQAVSEEASAKQVVDKARSSTRARHGTLTVPREIELQPETEEIPDAVEAPRRRTVSNTRVPRSRSNGRVPRVRGDS